MPSMRLSSGLYSAAVVVAAMLAAAGAGTGGQSGDDGNDAWQPPTPPPLLDVLAGAHASSSDSLKSARVYRYPDAPGQTKEELVKCYHARHSGRDPDDDAAPPPTAGNPYLPEDLGELLLLTEGNVDDVNDPDIDFYVVNPLLLMSQAAGNCNGMSHTLRLQHWAQLLRSSPATKNGEQVDTRHVMVSASCKTRMVLQASPAGKELSRLTKNMTFLINENNTKWAWGQTQQGVMMGAPSILVVPYLSHRYITALGPGSDSEAPSSSSSSSPPPRRNVITFIGALRGNKDREAVHNLRNASWAVARVWGNSNQFTHGPSGKRHREAALRYSRAMQTSRWCLHLPGDTATARRLFDAIQAGCLPVVVTGGGHAASLQQSAAERRAQTFRNLPFVDMVPYEDFAVFIDGLEWIENTVQLAREVVGTPDRVVLRMQAALGRWRNVFDYRDPGGALNRMVVDALLERIGRQKK